jgi:dihydropteroate synthase
MTRPIIMGVLNVTPDSFSDGGDWSDTESAIDHALELHEQGADIIDVGGESTRPGANRIEADDEQERVLPVIEALVAQGVTVSVDTMNASTAQAAFDLGAQWVNDVSAGLADPEMYRTIAETGVNYIAMHWRGHSAAMQQYPTYDRIVHDVREEFKLRISELLVWGIDPKKITLDPGLGFAKTGDHNWQLLAGLPDLLSLGYPLLIGASRKRFLAPFAPEGAPATARDLPTAVVSALCAEAGVWGVRVHDVASTKQALDVWTAWSGAKKS